MNTIKTSAMPAAQSRRSLARHQDWIVAACFAAAVIGAATGLQGYWAFKVATLLVFALSVRSLQLLVGGSGQVSLGHGAFFAIGAYGAGMLSMHGWAPGLTMVPVAALMTGVAGFLFGLPAVRLAGPYLALATFALALALPQLLKHPAFEPWTGGVSGLGLDPAQPPVAFLSSDQWMLLLAVFWCALAYAAMERLLKGPCGLAWMSLRDHPTAATAAGINVPCWKAIAFGVSSAMVGAAGAISTSITSFVSPDSFNVFLSLSLVVGVALSGPRSALGSLFAASFLVFVPDLAEKISQEWTGVIYGGVMLASVYVAPSLQRLRTHRALARKHPSMTDNSSQRSQI